MAPAEQRSTQLEELRRRLRLRTRYCGIREALTDRDYEYVSHQTLEVDMLRLHLKALFRRFGVNCVVDVGARHGDFAYLVRLFGYRGRIVSFEPISESFATLTERSASDPAWMIRQAALGSRNETAEINVSKASEFSSFLRPNDYGAREFEDQIDVGRVEQVTVRRLEDVWPEVTAGFEHPRVYLKMDTQGWDLEVIAGAGAALADVVAVQSEVAVQTIYENQQTTYTTVIDRLADLGFELSGLFPVSLDDRLRVIEYDYVGVRRDAEFHGPGPRLP